MTKFNKLFIIILLLGFLLSCRSESNFSDYQNGDIIFQTSRSNQSKAIQIATNSIYSHMGIVYLQDGEVLVFEAVQPVKLTPLSEWISRGEKQHFVIKRMIDSATVLTLENQTKMRMAGEKFLGKDYDLYFEWSDDRIYCSELVWKIYKNTLNIELGELEKLSDFDLSNEIVKAKLRKRYGNNIPLDELVISPSAIFNSERLVKIYEN